MTHMAGVAVGVIRAALRPLAQRVWGRAGLALQLHTHVVEQVQWPSPSCLLHSWHATPLRNSLRLPF